MTLIRDVFSNVLVKSKILLLRQLMLSKILGTLFFVRFTNPTAPMLVVSSSSGGSAPPGWVTDCSNTASVAPPKWGSKEHEHLLGQSIVATARMPVLRLVRTAAAVISNHAEIMTQSSIQQPSTVCMHVAVSDVSFTQASDSNQTEGSQYQESTEDVGTVAIRNTLNDIFYSMQSE